MYIKLLSIQADHQSLVRSGKKGHEEHHARFQLPSCAKHARKKGS